MSISVIVPGSLKECFNGNTEIFCTGDTIYDCLENVNQSYPGFKNRIFGTQNNLSKIMIFLNGDNINQLDGLKTATKDTDEISIIPLAAGG